MVEGVLEKQVTEIFTNYYDNEVLIAQAHASHVEWIEMAKQKIKHVENQHKNQQMKSPQIEDHNIEKPRETTIESPRIARSIPRSAFRMRLSTYKRFCCL
jgi:hypothetical protein